MPRFSLQPQAVLFAQLRRSQTVGLDGATYGTAAQLPSAANALHQSPGDTTSMQLKKNKPNFFGLRRIPRRQRILGVSRCTTSADGNLPFGILDHGMQPSNQLGTPRLSAGPLFGLLGSWNSRWLCRRNVVSTLISASAMPGSEAGVNATPPSPSRRFFFQSFATPRQRVTRAFALCAANDPISSCALPFHGRQSRLLSNSLHRTGSKDKRKTCWF